MLLNPSGANWKKFRHRRIFSKNICPPWSKTWKSAYCLLRHTRCSVSFLVTQYPVKCLIIHSATPTSCMVRIFLQSVVFTIIVAIIFTVHAQKLLFPGFRSKFWHYNIIRLSHPDILKESNNLAIRWHFEIEMFLLWIKICHTSISGLFDSLTLNRYHTLRSALQQYLQRRCLQCGFRFHIHVRCFISKLQLIKGHI